MPLRSHRGRAEKARPLPRRMSPGTLSLYLEVLLQSWLLGSMSTGLGSSNAHLAMRFAEDPGPILLYQPPLPDRFGLWWWWWWWWEPGGHAPLDSLEEEEEQDEPVLK